MDSQNQLHEDTLSRSSSLTLREIHCDLYRFTTFLLLDVAVACVSREPHSRCLQLDASSCILSAAATAEVGCDGSVSRAGRNLEHIEVM
jgi:hypothetical protein